MNTYYPITIDLSNEEAILVVNALCGLRDRVRDSAYSGNISADVAATRQGIIDRANDVIARIEKQRP
jgi:hypothetical protein